MGNADFTVEYPPLHELASNPNHYIQALDRFLIYLNPLTGIIEMMRVIILHGEWPNALAYASSLVASLLIFYAGRTLFMRKKTILVDII